MQRLITFATIISLLGAPVGVCAQSAAAMPQGNAARTFAGTLAPSSFIVVQLRDGTRIKGTLIEVSNDELVLNPGTSVGPLIRHLPWLQIASVERAKAAMSGRKKAKIAILVGAVVVVVSWVACYGAGGCGGVS